MDRMISMSGNNKSIIYRGHVWQDMHYRSDWQIMYHGILGNMHDWSQDMHTSES